MKPSFVQVWGYAFLVIAVLSLSYAKPQDGKNVAVMVLPWQKPSAASIVVLRAKGRLLDVSRFSFIVIAQNSSPDLVSELYHSGAFLVFNASLVSGCT